ncbi:hypothetical protein L6452_37798 [Arctium lappa]|uniref:Uncharacterized protein n=1 Tax=Arctium lappa TaxID=4217 RepID=A0ACB8Y4G9_ARCLA|nr:hypothetical protein L6452_37798 [Arctium lappa]
MKFFQSSSSETRLSNLKSTTVCRRLPCFRGHSTHRRIKKPAELSYATTNPGVVAKLMGLDSIPQRIRLDRDQEDRRNSITRSPPISQTPMVLEIENGEFFVVGFEAGRKGKNDSRSNLNSRKKLSEDVESWKHGRKKNDESKKKKLVVETSNGVLEEVEDVEFELEIFDQLVLELLQLGSTSKHLDKPAKGLEEENEIQTTALPKSDAFPYRRSTDHRRDRKTVSGLISAGTSATKAFDGLIGAYHGGIPKPKFD